MLKSLVKVAGIIAALALPGMAFAVGMGGINVKSALGQPLNAEIELVSIDKADKSSMSGHLAPTDAFKSAGIDYPSTLPKLKFEIATRADGTPYLKMTTQEAVNDPFVSLLVELDWASGKLVREYTFLLDPPDYQVEQPKPQAVQPIEPSVSAVQPQAQPKAEPVAPKAEEKPLRATAPMDEKALAPQPVAKPAAGNVATGSITVKRGDTLSKIAEQIKQPDVTLEQMLVALYRANAEQFDGKNMNRLRAGKILRRPDEAVLAKLSNKEAVREIRAQAANWHAYRQKLAAASSMASEQAPQQEVSGKISTSVADKAPAAKESAKEVLRLSKGEAPGDKAVGGKAPSAQDKIHALEEEAVARNKELQDSKDRIALLEKNIKEMQRLVDLKAQPPVAAKPAETKPAEAKPEPEKIVAPQPASAVAAASQPLAASSVAAASAAQPATPVAKPKPKAVPKVVPPPPSLMDEILGEPLYLAGGAVVLLGLGGLGLLAARRRGAAVKKPGAPGLAGESTGSHIVEPPQASPETGDFTRGEETAEAAAEEVDPISEAELFLNFGRDAQAEEILKEALSKDPNNLRILLKLLGIYANRNDVNSFTPLAQRVKDAGDAGAWEQAAALGRKIDPANPLYGGAGAEPAAAEAPAQEAVTDFVLDEGKSEEAAVLDFDLGLAVPEAPAATPETTAILSPEEVHAAEAPMDFDVTTTHPEMPALNVETAAAAPAKDEAVLDFDITSTHPSLAAAPESMAGGVEAAKAEAAPNLDDLIFDITSSHPEIEAAAAPESKPAADIGLGEISLNLEGFGEEKPAAAAAAASKDERWHEVATKLDLAKAYQEMGDAEGAREILEEVVRDGDDEQRKSAQSLLDQLSA